MPKFIEIESKSIIYRHKFNDNWFWVRYAINPYCGCQLPAPIVMHLLINI